MDKKQQKKQSPVTRFLHNVFVRNFGYKALALGIAFTVWLIIVGFGI